VRPKSSFSNDYRLYFLDTDGHIVDVRAFKASGDLQAIIYAGESASSEERELWNGDRRVLELPGTVRRDSPDRVWVTECASSMEL
jgi:hypothetical protein